MRKSRKLIYAMNLIILVNLSCLGKTKDISSTSTLSRHEAKTQTEKLFDEYRSEVIAERKTEMNAKLIKFDSLEMKFDLKYFGEKPTGGWNLYFSLHGGGQTPDSVNEKQWNRHKTLYQVQQGIVLIPRSPTNTWNMWHQEHVDPMFERLIQNMILLYDVDPNRVYLMGYSAGGDGVYQLAPRMADRFAAAAMMAGHPNETSPLGLRNLPFTIHMGENDTPYDRNKVAKEWGIKLQELQNNDNNGYPHHVQIHKGKGHWMELLDTVAISWMTDFQRDPFPKKIIWKQDDVTHSRFYWLKDDKPTERSLIVASIEGQTINIENSTISNFTIMLNDSLVNMDKSVSVKYLGEEVYNGIISRSIRTIKESIREYGDPELIFSGEIPISLGLNE